MRRVAEEPGGQARAPWSAAAAAAASDHGARQAGQGGQLVAAPVCVGALGASGTVRPALAKGRALAPAAATRLDGEQARPGAMVAAEA